MKKVVLMALALGLSLPAMASEKVIDMYKSENCGCCSLWGKAMVSVVSAPSGRS